MGLSEIRFRYPLHSDREKELHKKALDKITTNPFQLGFYWSLVEPSRYRDFVQACAAIPGEQSEPIVQPIDVEHGEITFNTNLRFDSYTYGDKDRLVQSLVDFGISPHADALDISYSRVKELEIMFGRKDMERLATEERAAFARQLSFHSE